MLMNARSGAVLGLNHEYTDKLRRIEGGDFDGAADLVEGLKQGEMLVDDDRDEYKEMLLLSRMARFSTSTMGLTIAPTLGCNFCCPYCYEKGQAHTTMTDEVADDLISFVRERAAGLSQLTVSWYGGEPLLRLDRIKSLTEGFS